MFQTPSSPIPDPSSFIWQNGEGQARKARPPAGARALAGATAGATLARATLEGARRGFFVLKILSYFKFLSLHIYICIYVNLGGGNPGGALAGVTTNNGKPWQLINREL